MNVVGRFPDAMHPPYDMWNIICNIFEINIVRGRDGLIRFKFNSVCARNSTADGGVHEIQLTPQLTNCKYNCCY